MPKSIRDETTIILRDQTHVLEKEEERIVQDIIASENARIKDIHDIQTLLKEIEELEGVLRALLEQQGGSITTHQYDKVVKVLRALEQRHERFKLVVASFRQVEITDVSFTGRLLQLEENVRVTIQNATSALRREEYDRKTASFGSVPFRNATETVEVSKSGRHVYNS